MRATLEQHCTDALFEFIGLAPPASVRIVCIGSYVDKVVRTALQRHSASAAAVVPAEVLCMRHPSPRSVGNTDWPAKARAWLAEHHIGPAML